MLLDLENNTRRIGRFCLDCLFPKECLGCRAEGEYLCPACQALLAPAYPNQCFGCRQKARPGRLCGSCEPRFAFDGLLIAADYEHDLVKRMVRACKYRFVRELALPLARLLKLKLREFLASEEESGLIATAFFEAAVAPVPLSRRRQKWRGFNQAAILAAELARFVGLQCAPDLLQRRHRPAQANLSEAKRLKNVAGSFRASGAVPELVILVDDVVTTGATLNECSKALKRAGAEEVWCLAVAKG